MDRRIIGVAIITIGILLFSGLTYVFGINFFGGSDNEKCIQILQTSTTSVLKNETLTIQYITYSWKNEVGSTFYSIRLEVTPNYTYFEKDPSDTFWYIADLWYSCYTPHSFSDGDAFSFMDGDYYQIFTFNTFHEDYLNLTIWGAMPGHQSRFAHDLFELYNFTIDAKSEMDKLDYHW